MPTQIRLIAGETLTVEESYEEVTRRMRSHLAELTAEGGAKVTVNGANVLYFAEDADREKNRAAQI